MIKFHYYLKEKLFSSDRKLEKSRAKARSADKHFNIFACIDEFVLKNNHLEGVTVLATANNFSRAVTPKAQKKCSCFNIYSSRYLRTNDLLDVIFYVVH